MKRMHLLFPSFLIIIYFVLIAGCSGIPYGYVKVPEGQKVYLLKGFSLAPPRGDGWSVQMLGESSIRFVKKLDEYGSHTYVTCITPFDLPLEIKSKEKFKEFIYEDSHAEIKKTDRFEIIKYEMELDKRFGEYSVRVHDSVKDFNPRSLPSGADYLVMDTYCYYIKYPALNKYFRIAYSERGLPEKISKSIREDAQYFFDSIKLITKEN